MRAELLAVLMAAAMALSAQSLAAPAASADTTPPADTASPSETAPSTETVPSTETITRLIVTSASTSVTGPAVTRVTDDAAQEVGLDTEAEGVLGITPTVSVVQLANPLTLAEAEVLAAEVNEAGIIARATPDFRVQPAFVTPNDPFLPDLWGIWNTDTADGGYSIRAPQAWSTTTGQNVVVAVLDTGITAHPDLDAQVLPGYDFISDVFIANDLNGRDDSAADPGDWITASESMNWPFSGCDVSNSSWHGTHVAGTIGAIGNNGTGVVGVAPGVRILPVRVLGKCGGTSADIIAAIEWASGGDVAGVPPNANPADVINMSLGGSAACFPEIQTAINNAVFRGTTVVVSAGNSAQAPRFPGDCNNVISVAAHARNGARAYYSSYGAVVDVIAPGGDYTIDTEILSTLNSGTRGPVNPNYVAYQGTSMAAPHVSGVAALLLGSRPTLTPAQVEGQIKATARSFPNASPCIGICGTGYLDAAAALAPAAIGAVTAVSAYEGLTVSWQAPVSGGPPTGYDVAYSTDDSTYTSVGTVAGTSASITGLAGGTAYWVRVRALNLVGTGPWTRTANTTTALSPRAPDAPTLVTVMPEDDTTVSLAWSAPSDTGGRPLLYYSVQHSIDDSTWITDDTSATTSSRLTGLAPGVPVRVRVNAVNVIGAGPATPSESRVAPRTVTVPSAPGPITVTAGNGSLSITWSAPGDDGGRPVASYTMQHSTDDSTWTTLTPVVGTSTTITGLANAQAYSVRVAATNSLGTGPWTTGSGTPTAPAPGGGGGGAPPPPPAPTITAPGAPVITAVTPGDRAITSTWLASDDTGGEAPTGFTVELEGNGTTVSREVATTDTVFADLANGVPYRLRVAAINSGGTGTWSEWSDVATPRGPASSPVGLAARAADAAATLTWLPPESDGGSPVSGYVVEVSASGATQQLSVTDTSTVLAGLVNGRTYSVRVGAVTAAGEGAWSDPVTVTPRAIRASAPRDVTATRFARKVSVTWTAPALGTPLRYVIYASIDGKPSRLVDTTRATRGNFTFPARTRSVVVRVAAVDAAGRGPFSQPVTLRVSR